MPVFAKFVHCSGIPKAERGFLLEYQKSVLLALEEDGVIDQFQREKCIKILELQYL